MKLTFVLLLLPSVFSASLVRAEDQAIDQANTITETEIAQTMKSMNEVMAEAHALDAEAASAKESQSDDKLILQRHSDILSNLESESDAD